MQKAPEDLPGRRELSEFASLFLADLSVRKGRSTATLKSYESDFLIFETYLEGSGLDYESVCRQNVDEYLQYLLKDHDPFSARRQLSALRGLFKFLVTTGRLPSDPVSLVKPPKTSSRLPKALSEQEVLGLLESVSDGTPLALRDRSMLELLYGSGLRVSELCSLRTSDFDDHPNLLLITGKGNKQRYVPLSSKASSATDKYLHGARLSLLAKKPDSGALFLNRAGTPLTRQGAWLTLKGRASAVGLGSVFTPHTLRHSCATHMVDHGADLRVVQELLGHADLSTTQIYTKVSMTRMIAIHSQFHPRSQVLE
ncbi:MAG: tyrosine recombinase [Acidimicrobiaceae bacterium]|nr:tyrosine recombinase [Acidimicrobiaceae bacterium]